jgi:hypothetical protein
MRIGLSVNLLMLLALTHMCFPRARRHTRKFFELSYYNEATGEYRAGWNDAFMVFYWIVIFTGLRAAFIDYILTPLAKKGGVKTPKNCTRFAEQAWLLVYYSVFWTLGMVRLRSSLLCSQLLREPTVFISEVGLHFRLQEALVELAKSGNGWPAQVVHLGAICILAAADHGDQH